jgi:hypothetical protein
VCPGYWSAWILNRSGWQTVTFWYLHYDEETQLHTIKTVEGNVRTRMTMTDDQLREFADKPHELYAHARETVPEKIIDESSG